MRTYIASTGIIFALIVVLHIWRGFAEGPALVWSPAYIVLTLVAAGHAVWAGQLLHRRPPR
jgi:hypothetical protein